MNKLIPMAVAMTFIIACESNHQKSDINLNNGEKWIVNSEMKPHIEKSKELLKKYNSTKGNDYKQLAEDLKDQNNALIKSCTMKGESHDELHKWLHPHMGIIEDLSNAKDLNEAETIISRLEASFKTYDKHFQ